MKNTLSAKQIAVSLLAGRDYSRQQIKQKLEAKNFETDEIEVALDACEQSGYIDDKRFAQMLLRSHIYKGHGPVRIKQTMKLKGVSSDIISDIFEHSDCDWFVLAKEKVEKKYANKPIADFKEKAKRVRFLLGQGFDYEQANYALSQSDTE